MPAPDTRPTVNFGTRYKTTKRDDAKAKRAQKFAREEEARYEAARLTASRERKRKAAGYRGAVESARRRRRTSEGGTSVNIGPAGRQYDEVE